MTEIPEHLLKRSKDRQQSGATPSTDVAATTPASAPAAVEKPIAPVVTKVLPDPAYVAAAKSRKKIPFWAMATLSLLPLWAFMYVAALKPQEKVIEGPLAIVQLHTDHAQVVMAQKVKVAQVERCIRVK